MKFTVQCKDCGKQRILRPGPLGHILPVLIFWMFNMDGSCCKQQQKGMQNKGMRSE